MGGEKPKVDESFVAIQNSANSFLKWKAKGSTQKMTEI